MGRKDFTEGSATISDLFYWINERHAIWHRRFVKNLPKPWTDDPILREYKFTNAYRQLDRGTIALNNMIKLGTLRGQNTSKDLGLLAFNIIWYRLFNLDVHAKNLGFVTDFPKLEEYMRRLHRDGDQIFTGAHMTWECSGEDKVDTYLKASATAWNLRNEIVGVCGLDSMESVFEYLREHIVGVGPFIAYEMVCDLRFTVLLDHAKDINTWCNPGPGACRGLRRLGLEPTIAAIIDILENECPVRLSKLIREQSHPPWELREVEHSLCEFDKYQRVLNHEGRPRSRYPGNI